MTTWCPSFSAVRQEENKYSHPHNNCLLHGFFCLHYHATLVQVLVWGDVIQSSPVAIHECRRVTRVEDSGRVVLQVAIGYAWKFLLSVSS